MEDRPGQALAARLKAALDAQDRLREQNVTEEQASEARRARSRLLAELATFARELGHVEVREGNRGVVLRYRNRVLFFEPLGEEDVVRVRGTSLMTGVHRLVRREGAGDWVFGTFDRAKRERYRPLWDEGMTELLQRALHLPAPPPELPEQPPRNWILAPQRPKLSSPA